MRIIRQWPVPGDEVGEEQPFRFEPPPRLRGLAKGEWDNSYKVGELRNSAGVGIRMGQAPSCWLPTWYWRDWEVRCTVTKHGYVSPTLNTERKLGDWLKEIGPICRVSPPPEWSQSLPYDIAKLLARGMASGLRHFTRTFTPNDNWAPRIVPVNAVLFGGQLAKFNVMKLE